MRNCNIKCKCSKCSLAHDSSTCVSTNIKCINCDGPHMATSYECPKRKSFIEMRQKMSTKNNIKKPHILQATPRLDSPVVFPKLPSLNLHSYNDGALSSNWSFGNKSTSTSTNQPLTSNDSDLFNTEEMKIVMSEVFSSLKRCKSKEDQLLLMFEIAAKYIYG